MAKKAKKAEEKKPLKTVKKESKPEPTKVEEKKAEAPVKAAPAPKPKTLLAISPGHSIQILKTEDVTIPAGKYKKVYLANGTTEIMSEADLTRRTQ